jgi:hypothetical protein
MKEPNKPTFVSYISGILAFIGVHAVVVAAWIVAWIIFMWLLVAVFSLFQ